MPGKEAETSCPGQQRALEACDGTKNLGTGVGQEVSGSGERREGSSRGVQTGPEESNWKHVWNHVHI